MSSRRTALAALALGLVAGAVLGSWGQRVAFRRFMHHGPDAAHMLKRLDRELSLDPKQHEQIAAVFETRKPQLGMIKKEAQEKFETLRLATDSDIRAILRPDQQSKFDELTARWKKRHAAMGGPDAPPPAN